VLRLAFIVNNENGRRPQCPVAIAQLVEILALFFDVHSHRDEPARDELDDAGVGVHLGFQPSAAASHRRCREVEEHEFALAPGVSQRRIEVVSPDNLMRRRWHDPDRFAIRVPSARQRYGSTGFPARTACQARATRAARQRDG
jgi:hypothetical protein